MSWLVRECASANAGYHLLRWMVERVERDPQIRVYEPTDYFPELRAEDIWPSGEPVSVSLIVIPTLAVQLLVPINKDRTIIAFHSVPIKCLGTHIGTTRCCMSSVMSAVFTRAPLHLRPAISSGFISTAALVMAFANPVYWMLLPPLIVFAWWASMFCYHEETLQAEVAADNFALETTLGLTQAGVFAAQDHRENSGPLYDDAPLQGVDSDLPERLQNIRRDIFGRMRADFRTNGTCDLKYYSDLAVRQHGMHVEGLFVVGFALALVMCSLFVVQNVSWPGPLALTAPAILIIFYVLVSQGYMALGGD